MRAAQEKARQDEARRVLGGAGADTATARSATHRIAFDPLPSDGTLPPQARHAGAIRARMRLC